jgi:hypothetical protein
MEIIWSIEETYNVINSDQHGWKWEYRICFIKRTVNRDRLTAQERCQMMATIYTINN